METTSGIVSVVSGRGLVSQWIPVPASVPVVSGPRFHVPLVFDSHLFGDFGT